MKIAIPSDDKVKIAPKFDEAKGFIIYELDKNYLLILNIKKGWMVLHQKMQAIVMMS
jgi:predicted Fe-Mo cluster-binding NifX family protein